MAEKCKQSATCQVNSPRGLCDAVLGGGAGRRHAARACCAASVLFSHRGALTCTSSSHPPCPVCRCMAASQGSRQGLLRVSQELSGMSSFGLSEVLVTCQINISFLSPKRHRHTHTHRPARTKLPNALSGGIGSSPRQRRSLNMCLCLCCRLLQVNGWQVEAEEGQST